MTPITARVGDNDGSECRPYTAVVIHLPGSFCRSDVSSNCRLYLIFGTVLVAQLMCLQPVRADVEIHDVQIGLDGMTKPGIWTRARVAVKSSQRVPCQVLVRTADPGGSRVTFPSPEIEVVPGDAQIVDVFFQAGRLEVSLLVEVVSAEDQSVLASRKVAMSESDVDEAGAVKTLRNAAPAWIVVGQLPGSPGLAANLDRDAITKLRGSGVHLTELADPSGLPNDAQTLSAWGAVIFSGQFEVSAQQSDALKSWTGNGGHLVLAVGTQSESLLNSPLADWTLAGQTMTVGTISDLSGLEVLVSNFADQGGSIPLEDRRIPFFNPRPGVTFTSRDGPELARGLDGTVATRHGYGFGRITLLGVDLDQPPLARWRGLNSFLTSVVDVSAQVKERTGGARISHTGITELATQLHTGMEQFDEIGERSTLSILGFTLLYLLIIGPLDWVVVHRLLKRPGLTWFTFPGAILLAVFLAGSSARNANGTQVRVNTLEIVDIDAVSGHGREHVWTSIFSPSNQRVRVVLQGASGDEGTVWPRVSWSGIPETYFGGMYRGAGLEYGRPEYRLSEQTPEMGGIENLPVPIWSDRVLKAEMEFRSRPDVVSSELKRGGSGRLTGDSSFTHDFPFAIRDWLLVDSSHIYYHRLDGGDLMEAGVLQPGTRWTPNSPNVGVQGLRGFLTGAQFHLVQQPTKRKQIGEEFSTSEASWDSSSTDIATIVRMLTLHDMAGGSEYTGLTNSVLSDLELSRCLALDRVILLGRIEEPHSSLMIDGETVTPDRRDTFIRVLLPVEQQALGDLPDFDK